MKVGTIVKLKNPCLGNPIGAIGVVFHNYGDGFQAIFQNGEFDGFSTNKHRYMVGGGTEADYFLKEVGFEISLTEYPHKNVMQVGVDFDSGIFDAVLKRRDL